MKIEKHLLCGERVSERATPNRGGVITPKYLIFHFTAGPSAESSIKWLCNSEAKASAHLVVGRDGSITQLAPFNIKTWHAGKSHWAGITGLNSCSIGIELDNAGELTKKGGEYEAWFKNKYPMNEVVEATHKSCDRCSYWHSYTKVQIETALELAKLLVKEYKLIDILGHDDIAPERKSDPGPAFPLEEIKSLVLGRGEEDDELYEVTVSSLNIRKGPGVEYDTAASPLPRGTRLSLLEMKSRWSKVDVEGENEIEGWVYNKFIDKV